MSIDDQLQKEAEIVIRLAGRKHLKNKLRNLESSNLGSKGPKSGNSLIRWLIVAAAAAILVLVPIWLAQNNKASSGKKLFAANFESYRSPEGVRGETPDVEILWHNAVAFYADENYNSAALKFKELAEKDENYLVQFYLGQSLLNLETGKAGEAVNAFQNVLLTEHDYRQQTKWYLALAHIKASNFSDANDMLTEIAKSQGHYKQKEAGKLSKKIMRLLAGE